MICGPAGGFNGRAGVSCRRRGALGMQVKSIQIVEQVERWRSAGRPAVLLVLGAVLALGPIATAEGKPSCGGKVATIVSNAATIAGTKAPDVILAGPADNEIRGEGGNDTICGGGGNDTIDGGRGNDRLFGEGGDDTLDGERGSDSLDGGGGEDRLHGDTGNDRLDGGPGNHDQLFGEQGDDSLSGGEGDYDVLDGGPGNDTIDGGPGIHDIASYAGTGGPVEINLGAGTVSGAESEYLDGIEDVIGGSGDDTLVGSADSLNRLDGGPGNDHLEAAGAGDEAFGGPGSDTCSGFGAETSCGPAAGGSGTAVELYRSIDESTSLIITGNGGRDAATVSYNGSIYTVSGDAGGESHPAGRSRVWRLHSGWNLELSFLPGADLLDPGLPRLRGRFSEHRPERSGQCFRDHRRRWGQRRTHRWQRRRRPLCRR